MADRNVAVRRSAAWSIAERPLEILKIQMTDKDAVVRQAVLERKGIEIILFMSEGAKEWNYFTRRSQGKVSLPGREPKTIRGIEIKEGVLVIGNGGRVIALGKPGKTEKLPDLRASYPGKVREGKRARVGTLLTRKGKFFLLEDAKGSLSWESKEGTGRDSSRALLEAEKLIKAGVSRELEF